MNTAAALSPVERVARIAKAAEGVYSQYGIDDASRKFLRDLATYKPRSLSIKQAEWLASIERKVFGEDTGENDDPADD